MEMTLKVTKKQFDRILNEATIFKLPIEQKGSAASGAVNYYINGKLVGEYIPSYGYNLLLPLG